MIDINAVYAQFSGFVFDLDGTLVNSEPLHLKAWQQTNRKYGMPLMTEEYIKSIGGISSPNIARKIAAENNLHYDPDEVATFKTELYKSKYMPEVLPFDKIAAILLEAKQGGHKVAVATGSQLPETQFILTKHHLIESIDAIVTSDQVKHGKPAPDTYLVAAQRLGLEPSQCVVFEDTLLGLQGIKAATMYAIQVAEGEIISPELIEP